MCIVDEDEVKACSNRNFPNDAWPDCMWRTVIDTYAATSWVVTEPDGHVIAYILASSWHIYSFATDDAHRRHGWGTRLLQRVLNNPDQSISLHVRVSNEDAIRLYERMGFEKMSTVTSYYTEPSEDAYFMVTAEKRK
jgi:ribosomal-protein-alanine N-acetyltransferase